MRFLRSLVLLLAFAVGASAAVTTVDVNYQHWGTIGNHTVQVTLAATENEVDFSSDARRWVSVQVMPSVNCTLRWTTSSATDALPLLANQTYTIQVQGVLQKVFPIAGGAGILYVTPLTYVLPSP